jgi:hypothetical protein
VSEQKLQKLQEASQQANEGSVPSRAMKDHKKANHPYLSRYGRAWKDDFRKYAIVAGSISITKMVWHMKDEVDRITKGTKYVDKGQLYHDALTLMTRKRTIAYLREHNLLKYWVLPLEGPHKGTIYNNSIPGYILELMPLDENLNMDIHTCSTYYAALTLHAK